MLVRVLSVNKVDVDVDEINKRTELCAASVGKWNTNRISTTRSVR